MSAQSPTTNFRPGSQSDVLPTFELNQKGQNGLRDSKFNAGFQYYSTQLFQGITVALALIPEAVAFSLVAGVDPKVGLHAAWILCLIPALIGGSPGMISGATGAMAFVAKNVIRPGELPLSALFLTVVLCGVFQIILGILQVHKLLKYVTRPVICGFLNGLTLLMLWAQLGNFKPPTVPGGGDKKNSGESWVPVGTGFVMGIWVAIGVGVNYLPAKGWPLGLISILVVTGCEWGMRGGII